jgi:hypothetical protein
MPEWYLITDGKPNAVQERFKSIYRKNPVRVALVVNWLVGLDQMGWVEQVRQPLIVMQGDPRLGNSPLGPQTIKLEQLATQLMPMFQDLGVRLVNASQVQAMVAQQAEKVRQIHNDADLAVLLRAAHACDYVCQGLATAVSKAGDEIPYDFKLTNCNNGDLAGGATWPVDARVLKVVPRNRRLLEKPENRTRYLAGQMLLALERAIGGGQTMNVEVRNAASQAIVQQVVNALRTIEEVTPAESFQVDNGLGTFTVRYSGSFDDVKDRINVVLESLNHVKMIEMNASMLRLDAKAD